MGAETSKCHDLLRRARLADGISLLIDPLQQFSGLVSPGAQSSSEQFVLVDVLPTDLAPRTVPAVHCSFQQGTQLVMAQRVGDGWILASVLRVDA